MKSCWSSIGMLVVLLVGALPLSRSFGSAGQAAARVLQGQPSGQALGEVARFQKAFARLDEFVVRHMKEENVPGLALAVTNRAGLVRVASYGWADVGARIPVTPETLFEIGSISKSFTAIALLQLREEGKLNLQAPVSRYLPWFRINSNFAPISVHHVLSHAAGLPRDRDDIPSSLYQAAALAERSTGFAPGTHFHYSNIGYQTLGYLVEQLTGESYGEAVRARILQPLGMAATEPVFTHATRQRLAVGYDRLYDDRPEHPSHPLVPATWLEYGAGDGSIASTPADLAAYLRMLLNRGAGPQGRILAEESFDLMTQPVIPTGEKTFYGYGLGLGESDGHKTISHGGGMVGYQAMLLGDVDDGLGVVVFINGPGSAGRVAEFALKVVRAALHSQELPAVPDDDPTRVKNAAEYAGTYTAGPEGSGSLRLVADGPAGKNGAGERLVLEHKGERIVLERRGKDAFYVHHPNFALFPLRFGREGKEEASPVVEAFYGADWYTNDAYKGPTRFDYPKQWEAYPGHYRTTHAWFSNFRIVLRKGKLWLVTPGGGEQAVVSVSGDEFRVGNEDWSPERIRFDTIISGKAVRANLSGCAYYRVFTP